ncbi:MAG: carboxypeptidase-like regulatory domain-containing protein, partial [Vicinamibacterales bacterium]
MFRSRVLRTLPFLLAALVAAAPAFAQQTGTISGQVTATDGSVLPGVTVEARSDVLPGPRVTVTGSNGDYRLAALPPGTYTITFTLSGMQSVTRTARVQLSVDTALDATLGVQGVTETVTVTAGASLVNRDAPTIQSALTNDQIVSLPVGQEYRDLIKLIPGVQYSQDTVRGPSAGGSGQDNVYQFDGANVTLPLFGTLSAEPAAHDIAQITARKGAAMAIDFDRSGGFTVDSVSKSGTSSYKGQAGFQFQSDAMAAALTSGSASRFELNRAWLDASLGGPIVKDKLFFYGSYYRPTNNRQNRANLYGDLPKFESTRNEGFGKLTFTPISDILLNVSYRDSHRLDKSDLFASNASSTTGTGAEAWLKIGTAEGSWILNSRSYATAKYTHFANETQGRPDNVANVNLSTAIGSRLPVDMLDRSGLLSVPAPIAGATAYNAFIQPLIDQYGYLSGGQRTGGGLVGYGTTFDADDFFRDQFQVGYNYTLGTDLIHDLHVGYQWYVDSEDLTRSSNGFGSITVPGGRLNYQGTPIYYTATFQQQGFGTVPPTIHSEYRSQNLEFNDTIRWQDWTFNAGVLLSKDTLYGQGLKESSAN